jgi:hypothetical protein
MIVAELQDKEKFFQASEASNGVFGSKTWLLRYGNELQLRGIYADDGQLIGGFYYLLTRKFALKFIKLPPYSPHCGLFYKIPGSNPASVTTFRKEVIDLVSAYFLAQGASLCILAFPQREQDMQGFIWKNFKVIPNYTYQIDITKYLPEITGNFDSKNRNAIAKAAKSNLEVHCNQLSTEELFDFFTSSLDKTGANIYSKELKAVLALAADNKQAFSYSAKHNGNLVAAVYCLYDAKVCYYLLGGSSRQSGVTGSNNLLLQKAIEEAKNRGCEVFDFEGSMLPGVEKFFRGFGGELKPYFTANKASKWLEIVLKFIKPSIF